MKRKKPKQTAADLAAVRWLTIKQASVALNLTVWHLRTLIWRHEIPVVRVGKKALLDRNDIEKYLESQKAA